MTENSKNKSLKGKLTLDLGNRDIDLSKIKVRKKRDKSSNISNSDSGKTLSQKEIEYRQQALKNYGKNSSISNNSASDVLNKIKHTKKSEIITPEVKIEKKEEVKIKEEPKKIEKSQVKFEAIEDDFKINNFDINKKIQASLKVDQEKAKEERKIQEQLKQEKEEEQAKYKNKKKEFSDNKGEESNNKKQSKKNNRRYQKQIFIIGDDDEQVRYKKKRNDKGRKNEKNQEAREPQEYKKISREVILPEMILISDLAERMSEKTGDVVKKLFTMGVVATSNQAIDAETAEIIIEEFGHSSKKVTESDVEKVLEIEDDSKFEKLSRPPIVTIMGHVDHGKTSLLDNIRSTDIVTRESGGITQHIGASRIKTKNGKFITFIDTPGHKAFSEMRLRGANVTDIVILVVAADDGIKDQTVEAINHARAAEVPIIVAINKIDKPNADPSKVINELYSHNIVSDAAGGDSIFVEVSAKEGTNIDKLEEAILLQAEMMELKSRFEGKSKGVVLESKVDSNKGVIATVLVLEGSLDMSDLIVVGNAYGKVRKMTDDKGRNLKQADPSMAVEIMGLDIAPSAGSFFSEVDEEKQARDIIEYRVKKEKDQKNLKNNLKSKEDLFKNIGDNAKKYLNIIIKADVNGSSEALSNMILGITHDEVETKIIHSATGAINESDVNLASASNALIIAFNVRANAIVQDLAKENGVNIRYYSVIYDASDDIKSMMSGLLDPTINEKHLGNVEIRQIYKITGVGKIAGAYVTNGIVKKNSKVRLLRDNIVIYDGNLKTLKRFKDDVKEVKSGLECGIAIENYQDIQEGDVIECYELNEEKRSV
jgi:translation initiation factor IF-2